jgi:hypothetical protein
MHRSIFQGAVERDLVNNPGLLLTITATKTRLNAGEYDRDFVAAIMQKSRDAFDIYDAYAFSWFWVRLLRGVIKAVRIHVGDVPSRDHEVELNNEKLKGVPKAFAVTFDNDKANENDGIVVWDAPIVASSLHADGSTSEYVLEQGSAPLEVGYTDGRKTVQHIWEEAGVARWPYGSSILYLFKMPHQAWCEMREEVGL